jgi:hypothetical protein
MRKQLDSGHKTQLCLNLILNKEIDASNEEIICFSKKDQKVTLDKELTPSLCIKDLQDPLFFILAHFQISL